MRTLRSELTTPALTPKSVDASSRLSEMTLGEISSKCGPPASHTSRTEDVRVRNRNTGRMMKAGQSTVETLTWDRGPRAAAMVVTVVDGTIKSIERKP